MDLCLASHRAVLKALQAFEEGELALVQSGALTLATERGDVRFFDGVCLFAPDEEWLGAELAGWLEELDDLSGVGAWWRPGLRAVLRSQHGRPLVTDRSNDLSIGGLPAASGFATHTARFLVAHGESRPVRTEALRSPAGCPLPSPDPSWPTQPANNPALVTSSSPLASGIRRVAPRPENDTTLRDRGEWRRASVGPWTLGEGRHRPPQRTEPSFTRYARTAR